MDLLRAEETNRIVGNPLYKITDQGMARLEEL